jgi:Cu(I)/Ag(I) efflux system membrane fusion protein
MSVENVAAVHTFRLLGRIAVDERRLYVINAATDGWITTTSLNSTGSFTRKNERLAGYYSPEILTASRNFLFTLSTMDHALETDAEPGVPKDRSVQYTTALKTGKDTLKNLGMSDPQIERIMKTREETVQIDVIAPADGFILYRNVFEGLRFAKGAELFRIADLSRVWILADAYDQEIRYLRPGAKANVIVPNAEKPLPAVVSGALPLFDPASRTYKVRIETDNPGFWLRPDMFVDVELPVEMPPALSVPADALLTSGLKTIVFVDRGEGFFEPRSVETGWRLGDRVEITAGLSPGERIVFSGGFFLDSESRLQAVAQGIFGPSSADPVCGTVVDEAKAAAAGLMSVFEGRTYYFCSPECRERFEKEPSKFVLKPARKRGTPGFPPAVGPVS